MAGTGVLTPGYWIGANGNTYLKYGTGGAVVDMGKTTNNSESGFTGSAGYIPANLMTDPNAPAVAPQTTPTTTAPANPNGTTAKVLNQGAVDNTQATIDQIPGLLQAALEAENTTHMNSTHAFDAQEGAQRGTYDTSTTTNQQNYDANFMDSIRAGIKGLGGLMNILRGTGAAGGSVEGDVQDVVGGVTSNDIRNGADTQKNNQTELDTSLTNFLTDLKGKRQQNDDTFVNNQRAIQRGSDTQLQDLYSKMAGFYGDAGDTTHANEYMSRAGSFTPSIAANTRSQVSNYDTTPVVVHAPNLTAFAAPTQPEAAVAPDNGQVGSGIFTLGKRKDLASAPLAVAQGA